jgi:hypothetical protein
MLLGMLHFTWCWQSWACDIPCRLFHHFMLLSWKASLHPQLQVPTCPWAARPLALQDGGFQLVKVCDINDVGVPEILC